jgi:thiamine biosynthesis lipoprotein
VPGHFPISIAAIEHEHAMKRQRLTARFLGGAALAAMASLPAQAQSWSFHDDHVLGTSLDIVAVAVEEKAAQIAADLVRGEIQRLDAVLSGWRADSELARLNRAPALKASPDLFAVIAATESWRDRTLGAFSARLGRLENAGASTEPAPLARAIADARVSLDPATLTIQRPAPIEFAVDGLAKGYIVDRAVDAARALPGLQGLMVDIGGDLKCWGTAPTAAGWRIGVPAAPDAPDNQAPALVLSLGSKAVATSGVGGRGVSARDPSSGLAATRIAMVTTIADHAADADALASAFSVMAPADSLALVKTIPGAAARIVASDGSVHVSQGFPVQLAQATRPNAPQAKPPGEAWPAGYSVAIDYEIPQLGGGRRSRNPYVTLWITNESGGLVRTLIYLAGKRRYIDENYIFWDKYGSAQPDLVESITRPTRPPGRYTLVWDGKDDQGRPVPQGKYFLNVEAAREHGGHNVQRIELNLGSKAVTAGAEGAGELGATHARYGAGP